MRKRNNQVIFRLSDQELEHLEKQLKISGLTRVQYFKKLIIQQDIKPRLPSDYARVVYEISKIGVNINQIAHRANASKYLSQEEAQTARILMEKCWEHVQSLK